MFLEVGVKELELLQRMIDGRLDEIGAEIRRSRDSKFHDELKDEKEIIVGLKQKLHESAWDVTA